MAKYFSSEKQETKGEDCGHLDDGEQQPVGCHNTLRLLLNSPLSSNMLIFPFNDGHQRRGNQEHHSPEEQEVFGRRTEHIRKHASFKLIVPE